MADEPGTHVVVTDLEHRVARKIDEFYAMATTDEAHLPLVIDLIALIRAATANWGPPCEMCGLPRYTASSVL